MINTTAIAALIRENKTYRITQEIQTGSKFGMVSMEASLVELYLNGSLTREQVLLKAQDPALARQLMNDAQATDPRA